MMKVTNHGEWVCYKPAEAKPLFTRRLEKQKRAKIEALKKANKGTPAKDAEILEPTYGEPAMPPGMVLIYAKRKSDGQDWYDYLDKGFGESKQTVKAVAALFPELDNSWLICPATFDQFALFPQANQILLEIEGYTGSDPQADFGHKVYDPVANTISAPTDAQDITKYKSPAQQEVEQLRKEMSELRTLVKKRTA